MLYVYVSVGVSYCLENKRTLFSRIKENREKLFRYIYLYVYMCDPSRQGVPSGWRIMLSFGPLGMQGLCGFVARVIYWCCILDCGVYGISCMHGNVRAGIGNSLLSKIARVMESRKDRVQFQISKDMLHFKMLSCSVQCLTQICINFANYVSSKLL